MQEAGMPHRHGGLIGLICDDIQILSGRITLYFKSTDQYHMSTFFNRS